jgi:hypothetical protein
MSKNKKKLHKSSKKNNNHLSAVRTASKYGGADGDESASITGPTPAFSRIDNTINTVRGVFDKKVFLNNLLNEIDARYTKKDYTNDLKKELQKVIRPGALSLPKTKRLAQNLQGRNITENFNIVNSPDTIKDALEELNATDNTLYNTVKEYMIQQKLKGNSSYIDTINQLRENSLQKDNITTVQSILKNAGVSERDPINLKLQNLYDVALQQEAMNTATQSLPAPVEVSAQEVIADVKPESTSEKTATVEDKPQQSTSETATPTNVAVEEMKKKGLVAAFYLLYDILAIVGVLLVVSYFILAIIDIFIYIINELKQKQSLIFDPNLFNKDTAEYKALHYNTNVAYREPYNIYLEQKIVSQMYRIVGLFMVTFGIQLGSYLSLKVLAILKNQEFEEKIDIPRKNLAIMILLFTAATVFGSTYKKRFLNGLQPELKASQSHMTYMKNYIYNNMTTNLDFLEALETNNVSQMFDIMNKQVTQYSLMKMIFTLSLYNYYKSNVSENAEDYEDIRKIFTIREIKLQQIDPIKYFYYKQNVFIPNMYVILKNNIKPLALLDDKGRIDNAKENAFKLLVNNRILEVNRGILKLLKLPSKKTKLLVYLLVILFIALLFVGAYAYMYKEQVGIAWQSIYPILQGIWNKITSLFSRGNK